MLQLTANIDFQNQYRVWDGFGVNYVETCQTYDYEAYPQDYGGFSTLDASKQNEIIDLIFGKDGLKPGVIKMFLDPFHLSCPSDSSGTPPTNTNETDTQRGYDHSTTTRWMRRFVSAGLERTVQDRRSLSILTTLYGPPGWMTQQGFLRGRDLDPACKPDLVQYLASWAQYLKQEGLPIHYVGLHNEGEDHVRWPDDASKPMWEDGHDYNMYWSPELVKEIIPQLREELDKEGLSDVGVAPGETTNWFRFLEWGYANAIADDPKALSALGLITSHGFLSTNGRWFGDTRSDGIDLLREKRLELHAWSTSASWSNMDVHFLAELRHNIYGSKVNAIIPWACLQSEGHWKKGDPNPGTAFRVDGKGNYRIEPGYWFYKQVSRAGQPGMGVCRATCNDTQLPLLAFCDNKTGNGDTFVVLNTSEEAKSVRIHLSGTKATSFDAFRSSPTEQYQALGQCIPENGTLLYTAPAGSATTFFERSNP